MLQKSKDVFDASQAKEVFERRKILLISIIYVTGKYQVLHDTFIIS